MNLTELNKNYDNYLYLNYNSNDTINSYKACLKKFLNENNRVYRLTNLDLKEYFINFGKKFSGSYYNQMLSSLRVLYIEVLKQNQKLNEIYYKKVKPKTVNILSKDEIVNSLKSIKNNKHRWIIKLLYIGALRVSELLNIKISDIDSANGRILIQNGKCDISRYIPISEDDLVDLRNYYKEYKPEKYLFESRKKGVKYSASSVRQVVKKIDSNKRLYPHLLRHTGLTNLVDNGHNLLKVQRFAGHTNSTSTERYYHLRTDALQGMILKTN